MQRKRYITLFAVKRDIFHAFFNSLSEGDNSLNIIELESSPSLLLSSIVK